MSTLSYFFRASGDNGLPHVEILPVALDAKLPRSVTVLSHRASSTGENGHLTGLATGQSLEDATDCLREYLRSNHGEIVEN